MSQLRLWSWGRRVVDGSIGLLRSFCHWLTLLIHLTEELEQLFDRMDDLERVLASLEFSLNETRTKIGIPPIETAPSDETETTPTSL